MKFTCPACHKVHRVTVTISTPGEEAPKPSANTRSMTRAHPQMPKKYATGAYPPVVDIPIDANFVLLDANSVHSPGIDLGNAADEQSRTDDFFSRKTEIIGDRRPPPESRAEDGEKAEEKPREESARPDRKHSETALRERLASSEETTRDDPPSPVMPDGRRLWDEVPNPPPPPEPAPEPDSRRATREILRDRDPEKNWSDDVDGETAPSRPDRRSSRILHERDPEESWDDAPPPKRARPRRNGVVAALLYIVVGALLLAVGYLGWQQYRYETNRRRVNAFMDRADSSWKKGEITAAASAARGASAALDEGKDYFTFNTLWNRFAEWTGLFRPQSSQTGEIEKRIRAHIEREHGLESFRGELDSASGEAMAPVLAGSAIEARKNDDPFLALAMEREVSALAMESLRAMAADSTPEWALARGQRDRGALAPLFSQSLRADYLDALGEFDKEQRARLSVEIRREIAGIAAAAAGGDASALDRFRLLAERLDRAGSEEFDRPIPDLAESADRESLLQLARLDGLIRRSTGWARSVYSRSEDDESGINDLLAEAAADAAPNPAMAAAAAKLVEERGNEAEDLLRIRSEVFGRMQSEIRRGRNYPGTRLAWSMLRVGFDDPEVEIDPAAFRFDTLRAAASLAMRGVPVTMEMGRDDYEKTVRARVNGYTFTTGWALLFHKPLTWMTRLAAEMAEAGVDPERYPDWEIMEGPGGPLALQIPPGVASDTALGSVAPPSRRLFFSGQLQPVTELPPAADAAQVIEEFRAAARRLHDGVVADESIPQSLRQALRPILEGTYRKPDARDYFDSSFCRRLIEANYVETFVQPLSAARQRELADYRATLGRLEAGYDEFFAELNDGSRVYAVARLEADLDAAGGGDQDPETGESLPRYAWRVERPRETVFFSPLPARFVYALMLAEYYDGPVRLRPAGKPKMSEVWHATRGRLVSYVSGADRATGDAELWNAAIAEDLSGRFDPTMGPPGWNFPPHVLERDDQGDPLTLATLSGIVKSPDFSGISDLAARRRAEDEWLDSTARTLSTPGELGLIFHQFFRYCSDSPLPELPNLIGSHYGMLDTHQTVYESLERRWVGRLIGDCDDLAEFFQELTSRQGKLSHVMQLPGHAACGYVEPTEDGEGRRFVVLQTGPVLRFEAPTLNDAVELAYRSFDREGGISHMTIDAVPLLLRFADEETRTPFVLSARIYGDREYAETMIRVQAYWHEHVYSAALAIMEDMVAKDQEIGNIKELGSLYERVGMYDKSDEMRRRELAMVKGNAQATMSTLLELVQLHIQDKNREKALAALGEMEALMRDMIRRDDGLEFVRATTFRSYWAMLMSRLGQPAKAWDLIRYDVRMTKQQHGRVSEPVLRTLVVMYGRARQLRDSGKRPTPVEDRAFQDMKKELEEALGRGFFKADDSYNMIIGRYFVLGRFALAEVGREDGLGLLRRDGPYPDRPKDHTERRRALDDEDWKWLRITPQLYLAVGLEMLDRDEYPELYDPDGAKPILEDVARAVDKGTGLGSDVAGGEDVVKSEIILSFLNRDLATFRRALGVVKERNYSSLYDESALTFGMLCGLIPLDRFGEWGNAFREFYPGSQHYFKVVYRALDKGHYDHALMMAEATARFFPDDEMLRKEADFVRSIIPGLKERAARRDAAASLRPAA